MISENHIPKGIIYIFHLRIFFPIVHNYRCQQKDAVADVMSEYSIDLALVRRENDRLREKAIEEDRNRRMIRERTRRRIRRYVNDNLFSTLCNDLSQLIVSCLGEEGEERQQT